MHLLVTALVWSIMVAVAIGCLAWGNIVKQAALALGSAEAIWLIAKTFFGLNVLTLGGSLLAWYLRPNIDVSLLFALIPIVGFAWGYQGGGLVVSPIGWVGLCLATPGLMMMAIGITSKES